MKTCLQASVLILTLILSGCATRYQKIGTDNTGGFSSERLSQNQFAVSFIANGFTKPQRANDFALLRAAETTLEYGFTHLVIDGNRDISRSATIHTGSTSTTSGIVSPAGTYTGVTNTSNNLSHVYNPGSTLIISCFEGLPQDDHIGKVYDARRVVAELKTKYKLK